MRCLILAGILFSSVAVPAAALDESERTRVAPASVRSTPVGMPARIEQVVLPGSELVVKPIDSQSPIVLRIVDSFPHGSDFRYDIEYYGLEPGDWNLSRYLERRDGSSAEELPVLSVSITSQLPPGQVEPHALGTETVQGLGGYRITLIVSGVVWGIGLITILCAGRKRNDSSQLAEQRQISLADRLRPVVEQAIAGELPGEQLAELEMMLVAFWKKQLKCEATPAAEVIPRLRAHPDAGPLLQQLEIWLHAPGSEKEIDLAALLAPYRNLPPDALNDDV